MTLPRTPFWFLRHGQTDYNAQGLSQGAIDIPLNETGRAQARAAAPLLLGRGIVGIVASPMQRARETAEIVNETLGLPLAFEPELREVVFGGMEGKPLEPWFSDWIDGRLTPPGAESFADITLRAGAALRAILARPGPLLLVSHGAFFRAVRGLLGVSLEGRTANAAPILCAPEGLGWRTAMAAELDEAAAPGAM
ncbi:MAG TPA: histidine phosphatase family protein [Acidiphilium sp.]|jgi:probable phosphoglycerate mutase|uniref:histidine phosphatase family protein n=1 Tax=unclassified Acidiphilium TaxID=2617493 RepID=UPI000BC67932|nr:MULTISPECIES: histidine phosphatase family protein [unclassified Acidiphilium]OYV55612.1 MAG: histidine phosphatase family protein [Acidiphilium sp. 20-67-58]HQT60200.1 histidine phosphatase family protein [Acidiphilium sp.]HQU10816.1 histidine phosphatase family protein [Acidiphilium sp.]